MKNRDGFSSNFGAIAALAGSAIGLGNIWKFPYITGEYGGGAFLLIYLLCIFFIGVPIMLSEFAIGRRGGKNVFGTFRSLSRNKYWAQFGSLGILAAALILSFYGTISGWTLEYVWLSIDNIFENKDSNSVLYIYNSFVSHPYQPIMFQICFMVLCGLIIWAGVKNGIERFSKLIMPLLVVIVILLGIRSCTLNENSLNGIRFLFIPDFSKITSTSILVALGHSFFSLSVGMGALMTYASYIKKEENLGKMSIQVAIADTSVALMAGLAILPATFAFNMEPSAGPGLVYQTLPQVFQMMPGGYIWGILFFILLTFAALTSAISLLEVCVAFLVEEKRIKRGWATILATSGITLLGILCTLSFGPLKDITVHSKTFFDIFDFVSSNILLPLGGILICIFAGWRLGKRVMYDEISNHRTLKIKFFKIYIILLKYVAPVAIFIVFLNSMGFI